MQMLVFLLSVAAAAAAFVGGWLAMKIRDYLELALGLTAGIILGLAAFDLIPEIFRICAKVRLDTSWPMVAFAGGFLSFHILEKGILLHQSHEPGYRSHSHPYVGFAAAGALIVHSFLDGAGIGLGFQAGSAIGASVATAVIGHRFADGFNTTNLMIFHGNRPHRTRYALYAAAVMPIFGGLLTLIFNFSDKFLAIYLGFFAGFLIYLAAGDILPQAHSEGSSKRAIGMTIVGVVLMYIITRFV
jgi:ZIP family zinc transporter